MDQYKRLPNGNLWWVRYLCSRCGREKGDEQFYKRPLYHPLGRPVSYECRACRSGEYEHKQQRRWGELCSWCGCARELRDSVCLRCWRDAGWRFCNVCDERKLTEMEFHKKRTTCIECARSARSAPPK